jgi:hypothetical protein
MTDLADHPPMRPLERYVQLETDHFCDCGYNLHGQTVTRDERLGFMVCRCPECGRWHPAGHGVAARSVWLGRLATSMLVVWIVALVTFFLSMGFLLATWQAIAVMEATTMAYFAPDGRRVVSTYDQATQASQWTDESTGAVVNVTGPIGYRRVPQPWGEYWSRRTDELSALSAAALTTAFLTGAVSAIATWHVRRRYLVWLLGIAWPFIWGSMAFLFIVLIEEENREMGAWAVGRFSTAAAIECAGVALGLWLGRPLARALARLFVPQRPRQALAFLWRADGKTPPTVTEGR